MPRQEATIPSVSSSQAVHKLKSGRHSKLRGVLAEFPGRVIQYAFRKARCHLLATNSCQGVACFATDPAAISSLAGFGDSCGCPAARARAGWLNHMMRVWAFSLGNHLTFALLRLHLRRRYLPSWRSLYSCNDRIVVCYCNFKLPRIPRLEFLSQIRPCRSEH
ncbi:hypothetical protein LIA77_09854 [Sarocladium implicatum]|nr:hypothetical protein LIA77_09854 [Sarocladium implicatum]